MDINYDAVYFPTQGGGGGGAPGPQGPKGDKGPKGDSPDHEWKGTEIRFQKPDGSWEPTFTDIKGPPGAGSTILAYRHGEMPKAITQIELTPTSAGTITGDTLHLDSPNKSKDLFWSYYEFSDLPPASTSNVGALVYVETIGKYFYCSGADWFELKTGSSGGGGGGSGNDFYVGMYPTLSALKADNPAPTPNKSFGFVTDSNSRQHHRYMFYTPPGQKLDWNIYALSDAAGFRLDPNPAIENINRFTDNTELNANAHRDAIFTVHPDWLATYDRDNQLMIMLRWYANGVDATGGYNIKYQNRIANAWVDTFGAINLVAPDISTYSVKDLKDGRQVIMGITCEGAATDVDICDGVDPTSQHLKLSKLRTSSLTSQYFKLNKEADKALSMRFNTQWRGVFGTKALGENDVASADRIHKETFFAVQEKVGSNKDYVQFYLWDNDVGQFIEMNPSGVLPVELGKDGTPSGGTIQGRLLTAGNKIELADGNNGNVVISADVPDPLVFNSGTKKPVKELFAGNNIEMQYDDTTGGLTVRGTAPSVEMDFTDSTGRTNPFGAVKSQSKFIQYNAGTRAITFVPTAAYSDTGANLGELIAIQSGAGIKFSEVPNIDGRFLLQPEFVGIFDAEPTAIELPISNRVSNKTVALIKASNGLYIPSTWNGNAWIKTKVQSSILQDVTGQAAKPVDILKAGRNINFTRDDAKNELTIIADDTKPTASTTSGTLGEVIDIRNGTGVTFGYEASTKRLTINSTGGGSGGSIQAKAKGGNYETIEKIDASNANSVMDSTNKTLILKSPMGKDDAGADVGIVKSIRPGDNTTFTETTTGSGEFVYNSFTRAKIDTATNYTKVTKIDISNKFAQINGDTLHLPVISAENSSGAGIGPIKNIKAGSNVSFDMGTGSNEGILTINAANGGGGTGGSLTVHGKSTLTSTTDTDFLDVGDIRFAGAVTTVRDTTSQQLTVNVPGLKAKTEHDTSPTTFKNIDHIEIYGDTELFNIDDEDDATLPYKTLNLSLRGVTPVAKDVTALTAAYPTATNSKRVGMVHDSAVANDPYKIYYCDAGKWNEVTALGSGGTGSGIDISGVDGTNGTVNYPGTSKVKFAGNTVLSRDATTGEVTVTSLGQLASLQVKVPNGANYEQISKMDILGDDKTATISTDQSGMKTLIVRAGVESSLNGTDFYSINVVNFGKSPNDKIIKSDFFKVDHTTDATKGQMLDITVNDPIVTDVTAAQDIEVQYPVASTPVGTIALQAEAGGQLGAIQMNNGTHWGCVGYYNEAVKGAHAGWSGDHIKRLQQYFPDVVDKDLHPYTATESWKHSGYSYLKSTDALNPLPSQRKGNCIVQTLTQSNQDGADKKYAELFFDVDNGGMYYRFHGQNSTKPQAIEQIAGLSEQNFSIYVAEPDFTVGKLRDTTAQGYTDGKIPVTVVQDPTVNTISFDSVPHDIQVRRGGTYNCKFAVTVSNANVFGQVYYKVTWAMKDAKTNQILNNGAATCNYVIQSRQSVDKSGYYYLESVLLELNSLPIPEDTVFYNQIMIEYCDAAGTVTGNEPSNVKTSLNKGDMDPYKVYFVMEPAHSLTKTGARIARTLRNTLGGISAQSGHEIRTQKNTATAGGVRVYGVPFDPRDLGIKHKSLKGLK